ncbi:hypothetical protein HS088_TW12G00114 [Tripterygium wilfordii]|uniref:Uncharacterized protein n=1 Tax=Tripterygium wilfordii TaxID=458696 RepID=A0A7J7CY20_TRIWF|nr:hypothetical protein HS088_TW12G00114 [Tripterygium wilfordii]
MRQRELLEFRTPQHPCSSTNNWGGASPLLARELPKESLEQRYLKLNSVRTRDEIFLSSDDQFKHYFETEASKYESATAQSSKNRGLLWKLIFGKKDKATLGSNAKKKRWFPKWDPKNRWPQGWC